MKICEKRVFSIERVGEEIKTGSDTLASWANEHGEGFFLQPQLSDGSALGDVNNWVIGQGYYHSGISAFMDGADCHLVAQAFTGGHAVVTLERESESRKKVKIPNVCKGLGIRCITPFEMLLEENAYFVLGRL